jgi:hypothetical protein
MIIHLLAQLEVYTFPPGCSMWQFLPILSHGACLFVEVKLVGLLNLLVGDSFHK